MVVTAFSIMPASRQLRIDSNLQPGAGEKPASSV